MPGNRRIIDRGFERVNGGNRRLRRGTLAPLLLGCLAISLACGWGERRAERIYDQARQHAGEGDFDGAVEYLETILASYPDSAVAARARGDVALYRGLADAVRLYPARRVRDLIIRTSRALHRFRQSAGRWPAALDELPSDATGDDGIDPWGRRLLYEAKADSSGYYLASLGADGRPGGAGEDADWLVEDGEFVSELRREGE